MAPLLKILLVFPLLFAAFAMGSLIHTEDVHTKDVHTEDVSSTYIVTMLKGTKQVLSSFSTQKITTFAERVGTLALGLQNHAQVSQKPVQQYLETIKDPKLQVRSLWAQNAMILKNPPADVVLRLKTHFSHLLRVEPDSTFSIDDPISSSSEVLRLSGEDPPTPWGIQKIQAEEAVRLLLSSKSGPIPQIRVATIDSGAIKTHEALRDNFLGEYGWFDPDGLTSEPSDVEGHGSHVMGTICGGKGIGVFPQAKWMACKLCRYVTCHYSNLLECAQWVLCPTLHDRTSPNCSMAAHVVSNSWGTKDDLMFESSIEAFRAAGIIVVKSAGNQGPSCSTLTYPAEIEGVISVGSVSSNDTHSHFSSKGPTADGRVKPDFTAPGKEVLSCSKEAKNEYIYKSGTSMACPHVSGLVALLLAYDPTLRYEQILEAITAGLETSTLTLTPPKDEYDGEDVMCGEIPFNVFPNNFFGHGRINALRSLTYLIEKQKQ